MKIVSWNVNGIRAALKKGLVNSIESLNADIVCLQETRATPEQVQLEIPGFAMHWNPAQKKGYSGTAVLYKEEPKSITVGMGIEKHDSEGRVMTVELSDFHLVNVYTPNSQRGLTRLDYRTQDWDTAFRNYVNQLSEKKPVILCGDLNVAHQEIDLANPKANRKNAGFTDDERASFGLLLESGFVDTFRHLCKEGGHYTWWSNFANSRARNIGWRIDYFCMNEVLLPRLSAAEIYPQIMGSDHCPISITIK